MREHPGPPTPARGTMAAATLARPPPAAPHAGADLDVGQPGCDDAGPDTRPRAPDAGGSPIDAPARKLVVLGLPWDTEDTTLRSHFEAYGRVDDAVVMRDRATGRSRGFGFVTFAAPAAAAAAASDAHSVDGRRCEAKFALPRGGAPPPRSARVFVARVPPAVTDAEFRAYFESFGELTDAYMPKDAAKAGHRGIGFVTFASPAAVDAVMARPHALGGADLAVDRATPKERDRGGGVAGLAAAGGGWGGPPRGAWGPPPPLAAPGPWGAPFGPPIMPPMRGAYYEGGGGGVGAFPMHAALHHPPPGPAAAALAALGVRADPVAAPPPPHQALQGLSLGGLAEGIGKSQLFGSALFGGSAGGDRGDDLDRSTAPASTVGPVSVAGSLASSARGPDRSAAAASARSAGPPDARAGPRIFVGKLPREATEADVKDHFSK